MVLETAESLTCIWVVSYNFNSFTIQCTSHFNWIIFTLGNVFIFHLDILNIWDGENFQQVGCIPLVFFFSEDTLVYTTLSCLVCCYLFSFFPLGQTWQNQHEWDSFEFVNERKSYITKMKPSWVGMFSSAEALGKLDFAQWFRLFRFYSWPRLLIHRSNSSEVSNITSVFPYFVKR